MRGYNRYGSYGIAGMLDKMVGAVAVVTIISVIAACIIYALFLNKKNEGRFTGFTGWLYKFFRFDFLIIEGLLKWCYLVAFILTTLVSLIMLFGSGGGFGERFVAFLLIMTLGNFIARVIYECFMVFLVVCKNTSEINQKMNVTNKDLNVLTASPGNTKQAAAKVAFCNSCGTQIAPDDAFCLNCGAKK